MISLTLLMIAVAYLFGSLSSAVVISQLFGLPDPRTAGSKKPRCYQCVSTGRSCSSTPRACHGHTKRHYSRLRQLLSGHRANHVRRHCYFCVLGAYLSALFWFQRWKSRRHCVWRYAPNRPRFSRFAYFELGSSGVSYRLFFIGRAYRSISCAVIYIFD